MPTSLKASAILIGTTIGVGIYAIPYSINQVGLGIGLFYLFGLGLMILFQNLIYGKIVANTKEVHQLSGYGNHYLGPVGRWLATFSLFVGLYGAMLAYTIKAGEFLGLLTGWPNPLMLSLAFFGFASLIIFRGLGSVSKLDLLFVTLTIIFILVLGVFSLPQFQISNFKFQINGTSPFLPFGIILFALTGSAAIPEVARFVKSDPKQLKTAIIVGTVIPITVYLIFTLIILGLCGNNVSEDALSNLILFLPNWVYKLGIGLGLLTLSTSFISIGFITREVWRMDFGLSRIKAYLLAILPALVLFLIGIKDYIRVIDIAGALTGGLTGVIILSIYLRSKRIRKNEAGFKFHLPILIIGLLLLIFILGIFSPFLI